MGVIRELPQQTYLLEYLPGTYGDFISGLISYSIEEFYDHVGDNGLDWNDRYWHEQDAKLARNRYPLSLRGGGYEHVENFTEFLLSHHCYTDLPSALKTDKTKMLFNTHPRIYDGAFRTIENKFEKTKCKFIIPDMSFDGACSIATNDYLSGFDHIIDKENNSIRELFQRFISKLQRLDEAIENIPETQLLRITKPEDITPDIISSYGTVNAEKFDEYKLDYLQRKDSMLEWNKDMIFEKMKVKEPERYRYFTYAYEHRKVLHDDAHRQ